MQIFGTYKKFNSYHSGIIHHSKILKTEINEYLNILFFEIQCNLGFHFLYSLSVWWHFMVWNLKLEKKIILWNFFSSFFAQMKSLYIHYFAKKCEEYFFSSKFKKIEKDDLFMRILCHLHLHKDEKEDIWIQLIWKGVSSYTFDHRLHWHYKNYIKFLN